MKKQFTTNGVQLSNLPISEVSFINNILNDVLNTKTKYALLNNIGTATLIIDGVAGGTTRINVKAGATYGDIINILDDSTIEIQGISARNDDALLLAEFIYLRAIGDEKACEIVFKKVKNRVAIASGEGVEVDDEFIENTLINITRIKEFFANRANSEVPSLTDSTMTDYDCDLDYEESIDVTDEVFALAKAFKALFNKMD